MRERNIILITCSILIIIGIASSYFFLYHTPFNFYKSEITSNGSEIIERLYFSPDKEYHTLFRTFVDPLYVNSAGGNSITIQDVKCSDGVPYAYGYDGFYTFSPGQTEESVQRREYTEFNEYGCNFGSEYGFFRGEQYWIEATFTLNADNLFEINGKKYIKFVAYSPSNHAFLSNRNFIVNGDVKKDSIYVPKDNVVIYIPYSDETGKNIILLNNFEYDHSYWKYVLSFILSLFPGIFLYFVWRFFGRENLEPEIPSELSDYPSKRKSWEVAAYFNPPFNQIDRNFLSSLILDLYQRKIIDVKTEKGFLSEKCYIKILNKNVDFDRVESNFINTIELLASEKENVKDGFVDISSASRAWGMRSKIRKQYKELEAIVKVIGKDYIEIKGSTIYTSIMVILLITSYFFQFGGVITSAIAGLLVAIIFSNTTSLLTKFKESYYDEYRRWQAFKNHLNNAPSLKLHKSKGVIVWGEYLVYAASFGIAEKVLKELQAQGIISADQAKAYSVVNHASIGFVSATGYSSSSGGHGGAGGGGVGGGGGGGR